MSYVPDYIIKKIIPNNAVRKTDNGISITIVNIISAISMDDIPGNPFDFIIFKLNGELLSEQQKTQIELVIDGISYTISTINEIEILPLGATIVFLLPWMDLNIGDQLKVEVNVPSANFNFEFTRVVAAF